LPVELICGTSLLGMPSRMPLIGSVAAFQPTSFCSFLAAAASVVRSWGVSTPVCFAAMSFW
jgi:hypothetical protein